MTKIGILSGGGQLPLIIGESLIHLKFDVVFFCIEKFCNIKIYKKYSNETISNNSLGNIIQKLKK